MGNLLLNSLEIRNFRGFRHLTIEKLGRVNLITGKNNVGKSALLEALQLYAQRASPILIWEQLSNREELRPVSRRLSSDPAVANPLAGIDNRLLALRYLFYGRREIKYPLERICIGAINSPDETFYFTVGWYAEETDEQGRVRRRLLQPDDYSTADNPVPRFTIQVGERSAIDYPLNPSPLSFSRLVRPEIKEVTNIFIGVNGLSRREMAQYWDQIALRELENDVLRSLRIIAPGVEGQSFIGDPEEKRVPIVRITGIDEPIPLGNLGNGMVRMLGISLALVNVGGGILLIDEIENGFHFSVHTDLWKLIFQLAHQLNIQVFATTHSWDCIEGFQKAAEGNRQEEGMLIRLSLKGDEITATLFDERRLEIATREEIEVR